MNDFIVKGQQALKFGFTTGSCAAAAAYAATEMLLSKEKIEQVEIITPSGVKFCADVLNITIKENSVCCGVRKYSGDDPDVTDGIIIFATVSFSDETEVVGGKGVGVVTKRGLSVEVGKAAINPVPMKMILENLSATAKKFEYKKGFKVVISAENGEEVAKKTFNEHLGIVGGISILGTSGIVEPMSEKAIVDTIKIEMDMKFLENDDIVAVCPGNYGRDFAKKEFGFDIDCAVKCSNYIGEVIDYAVYKGFKKMIFIGHCGKLVKLALGIMNTHSAYGDGRQEVFALYSLFNGGSKDFAEQIMNAVTVDECIEIIEKQGIEKAVFSDIGEKIYKNLQKRCKNQIEIEFIVFTLQKGIVMKSSNALDFIDLITHNSATEN